MSAAGYLGQLGYQKIASIAFLTILNQNTQVF